MAPQNLIFAIARIVTAALLFWALARHPIGYFTILRLVTTVVCLYAGYLAIQNEEKGWIFVFGGLALLFQPLIPLRMTRATWNMVDVLVGVFLLISVAVFHRPTFRRS